LKVSVIDLGFNSLKLVTYGVRDDRSFYVIEQKSVSAMLGEGMVRSGYLQLEPMHRTIEGLEMFREVVDSEGIKHVLPIATSAVREARNKEQFLNQIKLETGFNFRVLSEKEEAFYSYAGAFRSIFEPNVLFFDLGGGSLEIVNTANFSLRKSLSLSLGALRLTQLFSNKRGVFPKKSYAKMRYHIAESLPDPSYFDLRRLTALIGVGGTVRALASIDQELNDYPLEKVHRYSMTKESVDFIQTKLIESKVSDISKLDFVGDERARTVTAGTTVIQVMMEKFNFEELIVSTQGLRDGILAAFLQNPTSYHKGKPIDTLRLIKPQHGYILRSSQGFVSSLLSNKLVSRKESEVLVTASKHILTGLPQYRPFAIFHILMDEDTNMSHQSQLLMALAIVRTLRPKTSEWLYERFKSIAEPAKKSSIKRITAILKLIVLLEKTRSKVRTRRSNGSLSLEIFPEKTKHHPLPLELLRLAIADVREMLDISVKLYGFDSDLEGPILLKES
jgi:exopolyphosphatase / guanosine-5'-triphosphate,3'-diphosphate pyrophosphatase